MQTTIERAFCHEVLIREIVNKYGFSCYCVGKNESFDTLPMTESRHIAECMMLEEN